MTWLDVKFLRPNLKCGRPDCGFVLKFVAFVPVISCVTDEYEAM